MAEPELSIESLGIEHTRLKNVRFKFKNQPFDTDHLSLRYSIPELFERQLQQITLEGLNTQLNISDLYALQKENAAQPAAEPWDWSKLPFEELIVANSDLALVFPEQTKNYDLTISYNNQTEENLIVLAESPVESFALSAELSLEETAAKFSVQAVSHETTAWLDLLKKYLPKKYLNQIEHYQAKSIEIDAAAQLIENALTNWLFILNAKQIQLKSSNPIKNLIAEELTAGYTHSTQDTSQTWALARNSTLATDYATLDLPYLSVEHDKNQNVIGSLKDAASNFNSKLPLLENSTLTSTLLHFALKPPTAPNTKTYGQILPSTWNLTQGTDEISSLISLDCQWQSREAQTTAAINMIADNIHGHWKELNLISGTMQTDVTIGSEHPLSVTTQIDNTDLSWQNDLGALTGLTCALKFPAAEQTTQANISFQNLTQGIIQLNQGSGTATYNVEDQTAFLEIGGAFEKGHVQIETNIESMTPFVAKATAHLNAVEISKLAQSIPQFQGEIRGTFDGQISFSINTGTVQIESANLKLTPGTTGYLSYQQPGWLTQDASLELNQFVDSLTTDELLLFFAQDTKATDALKDKTQWKQLKQLWPQVITELSLQSVVIQKMDITLSTDTAQTTPAIVAIEGTSKIKGVTLPLIIDVPIRGQVHQTLALLLKLK